VWAGRSAIEKLSIRVGPPIIDDIPLTFEGDNVLKVAKPYVYAKEYKIERPPFQDGGSTKSVLNGVTLVNHPITSLFEVPDDDFKNLAWLHDTVSR
jgi:hypothetical protein